ncbi:MAG: hypothetical protein P0Y56_10460 [Candidatus Andeanibacterium colombiense]|uniref:Uncharacterized protein n=1 Tax=Candidatus Andeanibacterium colombiense TaxID=3121345 RepID=A0AAJ5X6I4_9SPHN|nr:MAG: hypothetical protein P0Y56_10460 [Sphingomonadaceae bacterium]
MSAENFDRLSQHDLARAEIEAWRAECLDLFAQGEVLIGALLELARDTGMRVNLYSIAAQRTVEAVRMIDLLIGADTEAKDASAVLASWQGLESRSEILAHGVCTETVDRDGRWFGLFDTISYRGNRAARGRWAVSRTEAEAFLQELEHSYIILKSQLGAIRLELGQMAA